ncbi:phosphotransferase family protein [Arthrobacter bambusae]|uniref:phosphotransferase family protein n=1 Tax=Arthrobacter bambusae TaxID=1338426 RepID=UPI002782D373|nr:phosphotransferase family protein [Arthrobacter bambusae]MDQ0242105.1 aminoglycoside phosphotransferase (APT) family kinase protein [Arthrobacter bambusae]
MSGEEALQRRVTARLSGFDQAIAAAELQVLPGGHSGLTYRIDFMDSAAVIKAVPPGRAAKGRHDMLRQARILSALHGTDVPVPAVIAVDETEPAWFAMSWARGEAVEPVLDGIPLPDRLVRSRAQTAVDILAKLHRVPAGRLGAPEVPTATLQDELDKWTKVMQAGVAEYVERGLRLAELLRAAEPEAVAPTLVHGDYRLGNLLFDGEEATALVDWEIWGVGDPRVDVGYFAVFANDSNFPELGSAVEGFPPEEELIRIYEEASGAPLAAPHWFRALGRFRMAAIMSHNLHRHRKGGHIDPDQELLPPTIGALISNGIALLADAGSGTVPGTKRSDADPTNKRSMAAAKGHR